MNIYRLVATTDHKNLSVERCVAAHWTDPRFLSAPATRELYDLLSPEINATYRVVSRQQIINFLVRLHCRLWSRPTNNGLDALPDLRNSLLIRVGAASRTPFRQFGEVDISLITQERREVRKVFRESSHWQRSRSEGIDFEDYLFSLHFDKPHSIVRVFLFYANADIRRFSDQTANETAAKREIRFGPRRNEPSLRRSTAPKVSVPSSP